MDRHTESGWKPDPAAAKMCELNFKINLTAFSWKPMDLATTPAALLARRLRISLWCQKQVVAGHRGRYATQGA